MEVIRFENVSYAYEDGSIALRNFNFKVREGEKVAVLGPNGAGKSTLLKIIAGLIFPSKGKVELFGRELTKKSADELRTNLAILFQDPDDQIFMPRVRDDVAFGPVNLGLGEKEIAKRVENALESAGLKGFEERVPHHLSYGEKKRVAIAGLLAMNPELLLLDEPTANLDPKGRRELIDIIHNLDKTTVVATHDVNSAIEIADKAYVINKENLADGTFHEIFSDRKLLETASLDLPEIAKLFVLLKERGLAYESVPVTIAEAVDEFERMSVRRFVRDNIIDTFNLPSPIPQSKGNKQ